MSGTGQQHEFEARLAVLGNRFRERSLVDAGDLERLQGTIEQEDAAVACETIRRIAHRLAGAAGTFGFPDISEAAGRLEEIILSKSLPPEIRAETRNVVAKIRSRLEAA